MPAEAQRRRASEGLGMAAGGRKANWLGLVIGAMLVGLVVGYLSVEFPEVRGSENSRLRLVVAILWVALLGGTLLARTRSGDTGLPRNNLAIWLFIGLGLLTLYSFGAELGWLKVSWSQEIGQGAKVYSAG